MFFVFRFPGGEFSDIALNKVNILPTVCSLQSAFYIDRGRIFTTQRKTKKFLPHLLYRSKVVDLACPIYTALASNNKKEVDATNESA